MRVRKWKKLAALADEVAEKRLAHVYLVSYPSVRTGNEYLYILLDIFATEDPRFWAIGLHRCPEKGTFQYTLNGVIYYGEVAARMFLEADNVKPLFGASTAKFQAMLYQDRRDLEEGVEWLKGVVRRLGGDEVDVSAAMYAVPYSPMEGFFGAAQQ